MVGACVVLVRALPLMPILVLTQVVNAVLLLPLLVFMYGISRDRDLHGRATRRPGPVRGVYLVAIALIGACVGALLVLSVV